MKTHFFLVLVIACLVRSVNSLGQTIGNREGYVLSASNTILIMDSKRGARTDIFILKSKSFENAEIELSLSILPDGVSVEIEKDSEDLNLFHLTFYANQGTKEGEYTLILYGKHPRRSKGIMLKLSITDTKGIENPLVSTDN